MASFALHLFGPPRLLHQGQPVSFTLRRSLALFIYLAVTKKSHSRDALATLFWPTTEAREARASLRRTLHRLTTTLGSELFDISPETIAIAPHADLWLDIEQFQQQVTRGLPHPPGDTPLEPVRVDGLCEAITLYTDDFLAGFTLPDSPGFDDWQFFHREELRQMLAGALEALARTYERRGELEPAIEYARRWLMLDPLHEPVHRYLMRLYAWSNQYAAAHRQYAECLRLLDEELGAPPEEETQQLHAAIRVKELPLPPYLTDTKAGAAPTVTAPQSHETARPLAVHAPSTPAMHNLPAQATPFVGRERELAQVNERLCNPACRLLTLVGPGGVGKTRLAMQAARQLAEQPGDRCAFARECLFVDLTSVQTVDGIVVALAEALHLGFHAGSTPLNQVLDTLRERELVLLLDNFEHLLDGAYVVEGILQAAPNVKLLITSREALNLAEEWFQPVSGLAFPSADGEREPIDVATVQTYDAVRFFEQSAHRANSGFSLGADYDHVRRICRLVDGNPLALELAAAWLKSVTAEVVAHELEQSLDILTAQHRNIPARHRSMRIVLERSWAMLTESEQQALMRLSICYDGFRYEAAAQMADATLLTLAALVEKALASATQNGRYRMHELIRHFALDRLHATPEAAHAAHARHAAYYLNFVHSRAARLVGHGSQLAIAEIVEEFDNVQRAWRWAVAQHDVAAAERVVMSLGHVYWIRGRIHEAQERFGEALAELEQAPETHAYPQWPRLRMALQRHLGSFDYFLGDYTAAQVKLEVALHYAEEMADLEYKAEILNTLGAIAGFQGQIVFASERLRAALSIYEEMHNRTGMADVQQELSRLSIYIGDYAEAIRWAEASLHNARAEGRRDYSAYALITIGWANFCLGAYPIAKNLNQAGLAEFESIGHQLGIALALGGLGMMAWAGDAALAIAHEQIERSLVICRRLGHRLQTSHRLSMLALLAIDQGAYADAVRLADEGVALAQRVGNPNYEVLNLCCLAQAWLDQGSPATGRMHLIRALRLAEQYGLLPRLMMAFYVGALYLTYTLSDPAHGGQSLLALQLLALARDHPAGWCVIRERAARRYDELAANLPDGANRAARLPPLDCQAAVTKILGAL